MSDPMTNVEIEDVLTSIRRLVSEDHRPPSRLTLEAPHTVGKLVLTPALRIVPDPARIPVPPLAARRPAAAPAAGTPSPSPSPSPSTLPMFDPVSHRAAAAVLEAALSARADDWEPDGSEVDASTAWAVEWEAADPEMDERAGPALKPETDLTDGLVFTRSRARATPPQVEPTFEWLDSVPVAEPPAAVAPPPVELPAMPAEAPPAVALSDDLPEDLCDDLPGDPYEARADDLADQLAAGLADDLSEDDSLLLGDETLIDEDALRDLVRDVLREELQGNLGERITRNVRKLVRAEINRVLAARDLG